MSFAKSNTQVVARTKLPVQSTDAGSSNKTITPTVPCKELLISNDSTTANLTFEVIGAGGSISFTLLPGDVSDERYPAIDTVNITATDAWRVMLRSGVIE